MTPHPDVRMAGIPAGARELKRVGSRERRDDPRGFLAKLDLATTRNLEPVGALVELDDPDGQGTRKLAEQVRFEHVATRRIL